MNQKMVAPVEIEEEEVDNMMMSLEDPRKLQGNNECSAFWLCDSILGFDGRKVRNTDPLLGDECVDRCIPGPILWLFLGPLNYECGICFGS